MLFLAGALGFYSCTSQQKSGGNDAAPLDSGDSKSGADAVGSIPEDMLAEEKGAEPGKPGDSAAATPTADPFSDLKEEEKAASEVSDSGGSGSTGNMKTYTVKSGDTLMKIAFSLYGDIDRWKDLRDWNKDKLKKASKISKGMQLTYEEPASPFQAEQLSHTYEIKKGDTLAGIADEVYGRKAKYKKLQKYNARMIKNPNRIFAGFTIFYDITEKEVAEAEARRQQRMAGGGSAAAPEASASSPEAVGPPAPTEAAIPSPIAPAPEAAPPAPKAVASRPASVAPAPAPSPSQVLGPPSPGK
jgi:LysM repeat protein